MRRLDDWALVPAEEMAALYRREAARWHDELHWESADTWDALERARRSGRVPGLVARLDSGAIGGWIYYYLHGAELQIGALTAASPGTAAALLDAVLASPAALVATRILFFAFTDAPAVAELLTARGFALNRQHYLIRPLTAAPADAALRPWHDADLHAVAAVLAAAYDGPDPRRAFVPSGTAADWHDYVRQLTTTTGCGRFQPALCRMAARDVGPYDGVALVTAVSESSAHLAQLAVHPGAGGTGLGRRLLASVAAAAAAAGYARLTLLVSEDNTRARRLYDAAGFTERGVFMAATRAAQPRRSTSEACCSGGASTRR